METLGNGRAKHSLEMVLINRVEYADGSIWERKGWKFSEISRALKLALATPWTEACRAL